MTPSSSGPKWRAQRIGWVVWSLLLVAAGLGLIGPGWLSDREAKSLDGTLTVGYERFLHYHHPSQLDVSCRGTQLDGEVFRVSVDRSLLDRMQILRIEPEPEHRRLTTEGVTYAFRRDAQADLAKVVFHVEYEQYGGVEGEIALAGADPVTVKQFVYP